MLLGIKECVGQPLGQPLDTVSGRGNETFDLVGILLTHEPLCLFQKNIPVWRNARWA